MTIFFMDTLRYEDLTLTSLAITFVSWLTQYLVMKLKWCEGGFSAQTWLYTAAGSVLTLNPRTQENLSHLNTKVAGTATVLQLPS